MQQQKTRQQDNPKCLIARILQIDNSALLRRWFWVRVPANPKILLYRVVPGSFAIRRASPKAPAREEFRSSGSVVGSSPTQPKAYRFNWRGFTFFEVHVDVLHCGPQNQHRRFAAAGSLTNRPETPAILNLMPPSSSRTPSNPGAVHSAGANREKAIPYQ
jgi:hypothetical protein